MYQPHIESQSQYLPVRQIRYHIRTWGEAKNDGGESDATNSATNNATDSATPIVMLHGWMDIAASWQFVVDELHALQPNRHIIAPDWRGFGYTYAQRGTETIFFPDYLADLEYLLDELAPNQQVDLVGHSMGGHIALLYAGIRPERIRRVINIDGFGMPATTPDQSPQRLSKWLDMVKQEREGKLDLHPYPDIDGVVRRLQKSNPRLPDDKAQWLATRWSQQGEDGNYRILGAPAHKVVNPYLFRVDEVLACYSQVQAPALVLKAEENRLHQWHDGSYTLEKFIERMHAVPNVRIETIADAGHMLHHDQPKAIAEHIAAFCAAL